MNFIQHRVKRRSFPVCYFMKSNGFQAFKNNASGEEDKDDKDGSRYAAHMRNYDKPWLINSTNRELSSTQKVLAAHQNWRRPSAKMQSRDKHREELPEDKQGADFIDFDQYKKDVNNMISAKETSLSLKNNLESRETAENKSEENQKTSRKLLHYEVGQRLGKGSYAVVHEAVDTNTHLKCAIKTYEKAKMNNKTRRTIIEREIQVLNMVDHPRLIKLHKVIQTKNHVQAVDSRSTS